MDRLIALVLLRFKLELRAMLHARERRVGLALAVPFLFLFSGLGAMVAYAGVRSVARADRDVLAPLLSAVATGLGVFWILSPLLTGFALAETHDLTRLVHFPVPLPTLALSSLIANLAQPTVLAEVPIAFAIAAALGEGATFLLALMGVLSTLLFFLAASQAAGLVLHALTRNRRLHDAALFLALGLGFALSLLPMLILAGGLRPFAGGLARAALRADVFALSPFAWGARAAVHGGRGELAPFVLWLVAQWLAIAVAVAVSIVLIKRIYQGELKLGIAAARAATRARMWLPGATGALLEKDLRVAWRDPALKATLFMGLAMPLVFLVIVSQTGAFGRSGTGLLVLATYVGMATFGSNAFGDGAARRRAAPGLPAGALARAARQEPGRDPVPRARAARPHGRGRGAGAGLPAGRPHHRGLRDAGGRRRRQLHLDPLPGRGPRAGAQPPLGRGGRRPGPGDRPHVRRAVHGRDARWPRPSSVLAVAARVGGAT